MEHMFKGQNGGQEMPLGMLSLPHKVLAENKGKDTLKEH
jgi:hypothetical protein